MRYTPRFSSYLLAMGLLATALPGLAQEQDDRVEVVKPQQREKGAGRAAIDSEHFEVGAHLGALSAEDFSTQLSGGVSFSYHISRRFMVEAMYGRSDVDRATFEDISGGNFLSDADRQLEHASLLAGYRLIEGRSFLGENRKYSSYLYALAGPNQVSFAGEDNTGLTLGLRYKTVLTDWSVLNLDFRDIVFERSFLGEQKTTHNTEVSLGVTFLF